MISTPNFSSILGTGQAIIPVGARAFDVTVMSGQATVGGAVYVAPFGINWAAADSKLYLGGSIAVGTTGVGNRVGVFWTT